MNRRTVYVVTLLAVAAAGVVLLAPVQCVGSCDADARPAGDCVESCNTLLGYSAPSAAAVIVVAVVAAVAVAVAWAWCVGRRDARRRR